jgi:hypothetical protein
MGKQYEKVENFQNKKSFARFYTFPLCIKRYFLISKQRHTRGSVRSFKENKCNNMLSRYHDNLFVQQISHKGRNYRYRNILYRYCRMYLIFSI